MQPAQMSNWQIIVGLAEKLGVFAIYVVVLAVVLFLLWWAIEVIHANRQWKSTKAKLDKLFKADLDEMNSAFDSILEDAMRQRSMREHPSNRPYDWDSDFKDAS